MGLEVLAIECPLTFPALLPRIMPYNHLVWSGFGVFGVCAGMMGGFWKSMAEPSR